MALIFYARVSTGEQTLDPQPRGVGLQAVPVERVHLCTSAVLKLCLLALISKRTASLMALP